MSAPSHTVEDFGQPEYLDGAQMRFALADEHGRRSAYVGTQTHAVLYASAPDLLEAAREALAQVRASDDFNLRRGHQAAALERAIAKATGADQ